MAAPGFGKRGDTGPKSGNESITLTLMLFFRVPLESAARIFSALVLFALLLVLVTALAAPGTEFSARTPVRQLNLRGEGNIAVWFSSLLLAATSMAAWGAALRIDHRGHRSLALVFRLSALFFLCLSADEAAQLHEYAGKWMTARGGRIPGVTDVKDTFGWLLLGAPAGLVFAGAASWAARQPAIRQLRASPILLAAAACWLGVIGFEFLESQLLAAGIQRHWEGAAEEGLELAGSLLFLRFFSQWNREETPPITEFRR
jgi:hypothetical protein